MTPLFHDPVLMSATAVSALFSAIWEGTILALAVAICLRFLPRLSAASRSVVWMSVFSIVILLHVIPVFPVRNSGTSLARGFHGHAVQLDMRWSIAIAAVWALLSAWRLSQLVLTGVRLHRLAGTATPLHAEGAIAAILGGKSTDGTNRTSGRAAELCTSDEVERPCVFGFLRPRVLIPPAVAHKLSAQELEQVVLHEMEHLRRGDDWSNLLQKLALALFPLNPVLLWVERRVCAERELACDDRVLRSSGARKAYAICLTHLAEYSMVRRSLSLVLGAWERQSELVRRVHRLLRGPGESIGGRNAVLLTGGVICAVLASAAALAGSPQLISFTVPQPAFGQAEVQGASLHPAEMQGLQFERANVRSTGQAVLNPAAQLVKAVMPMPAAPLAVLSNPHSAKPVMRNVVKKSVKRPSIQDRQAWLVLTEWNESVMPPRIVFAVAPGNRVTYEAVEISSGWLIVQI
jgi:beta-lactamase regulating signal transducer with metallopeptidase domain